MKYLKLFEQFDEFDPFGEESKPVERIRVGDTVICIDDQFSWGDAPHLKIGKKYKVKKMSPGVLGNNGNPRVLMLDGFGVWFNTGRFKKIEIIKEQLDEFDPFGEESHNRTFLEWFIEKYSSYSDKDITVEDIDSGKFKHIKRIDAQSANITSLDGIEKFPNLKALFLYDNKLKNLRGLEKNIKLNLLSCPKNELTSLEGIENLINLTFLDIGYNKLRFTNNRLMTLVNIKEFHCQSNEFENINNISFMPKLKELYCWDNEFSELYKKLLTKLCERKNIYVEL